MAGVKKNSKSIGKVIHQNELFSQNSMILSLNQTRLFLYILSAFPMENGQRQLDQIPPVEVDKDALAQVFHFECAKSDWLGKMKEIVSSLRDFSVVCTSSRGTTWFPLFTSITQRQDGGAYLFQFHPHMAPYLTRMIGGRFTSYEFGYALRCRSTYSVRLYDMLKEYAYKGTFSVPLDEFRVRMGLATRDKRGNLTDIKIPQTKILKRNVLVPAVAEINEKTDIRVSFALEKGEGRGGPTVGISFTVEPLESVDDGFAEFAAVRGGARLAPESAHEPEAIVQEALEAGTGVFLGRSSPAQAFPATV